MALPNLNKTLPNLNKNSLGLQKLSELKSVDALEKKSTGCSFLRLIIFKLKIVHFSRKKVVFLTFESSFR